MATTSEVVAILDAGAQYGKVIIHSSNDQVNHLHSSTLTLPQQLIDRAVRELKVETELLPLNTPAAEISAKGYKYVIRPSCSLPSWLPSCAIMTRGIIISGGPNSVYAANAPAFDEQVLQLDIPVFGICYGFQVALTTTTCFNTTDVACSY
jgi:GMP synthase (glutamine-hydrolysing)